MLLFFLDFPSNLEYIQTIEVKIIWLEEHRQAHSQANMQKPVVFSSVFMLVQNSEGAMQEIYKYRMNMPEHVMIPTSSDKKFNSTCCLAYWYHYKLYPHPDIL